MSETTVPAEPGWGAPQNQWDFTHEDAGLPPEIRVRILERRETIRTVLVITLSTCGYGGLILIAALVASGNVKPAAGAAAAALLSPVVAGATTAVAFYFRPARWSR